MTIDDFTMDQIIRKGQQARLQRILNRHVRASDADVSDHVFMKNLARRYLRSRKDYLVDPNE